MNLLELLETLLKRIYPISGYVIVGALLLVVSGGLSYYSTAKLNLWKAIWQPVDVVHQQVPSAAERVQEGVVGCLLGVPARILQWICFYFGLDLLLFQGRISLLVAEQFDLMGRIR